MTLWKNYYLARNVDDALHALTGAAGPARLVAGGTDLLLDMQQGRHPPVDTLVDVTEIPELTALEIRQDSLYVGAAVPLNRIVASPLVSEHARALVEASALIGGPQVRNTATLGGNVAHALPAGDGTIALVALDASAEVANPGGCRRFPILELFHGPGRSSLEPARDLLLGFYLPLGGPGQASAFRRVMRPQGVAIAILNMAAWVRREGDRVGAIRLALGPAGPTPQRAFAVEEFLCGKALDEQVLALALDALLETARFRTSPHRATLAYRRHLAGFLLGETLSAAWERTFPAGEAKPLVGACSHIDPRMVNNNGIHS
jgi:carbon-monoxide dehydrogenase medium subunit